MNSFINREIIEGLDRRSREELKKKSVAFVPESEELEWAYFPEKMSRKSSPKNSSRYGEKKGFQRIRRANRKSKFAEFWA